MDKQDFKIYFGIVEDRMDPLKLGRCKVRVVGLHSPLKEELSTEDLPWAYPLQPITSAAISGVGYAPVGLVEGSWVCVIFKDEFQQFPVILGSIGGIPNDGIENIKPKSDFPADKIKKFGGYSKNLIQRIKAVEQFREVAVPYDGDETGTVPSTAIKQEQKYVIGYKSRYVDKVPVTEGQTITPEKAESQLKVDLDAIFAEMLNIIRCSITQSMIDAIVMLIHDIGIEAFKASPMLSEMNTSKYDMAAATMLGLYSTAKQKKRRAVEKTLFFKDGYPASDVEDNSTKETDGKKNAFVKSDGKYPLFKNEPDTNRLARHESINSTIVANKEAAAVKGVAMANGEGSWDQPAIPYNSDYPFNKMYASEAGHLLEFDDTEGSERVHLYHKAGTFTEIDVNGTQVNRIVGDGYEILERNGYVSIKGARHVNVAGGDTLKVSGTSNVEVSGKTTVVIRDNANIAVSGNTALTCLGSIKMKAGKSFKIEAKSFEVYAENGIRMTSPKGVELKGDMGVRLTSGKNIDIKAGPGINLQSDSAVNLKSQNVAVDGSASVSLKTVMLNAAYSMAAFGGSASSAGSAAEAKAATKTGLPAPPGVVGASKVSFSELSVPKRQDREASNYETPTDGDGSAYKKARLASGSLEEDKPVTKDDIKKEEKLPRNTKQPPDSSCDIIFGMSDIPRNLKLSNHFNLLMLTANGSRPVVNQMGLSKQEIACNLKGLCENCLDPIKEAYPNIIITSGFRRPGDVPNSSKTSQHYNGEAADLVFQGFSKAQVYAAIKEIQSMVPYDQLILEYSGSSTVWVHVSFKYKGARKQTFTMKNHVRCSSFGKYLLL